MCWYVSRALDARGSSGTRDLNLPSDDVPFQRLEPGTHVGRDELRIVRVVHVPHAILGEAVLVDAALEAAILHALDDVEHRVVDAFHHRREHEAGRFLELI